MTTQSPQAQTSQVSADQELVDLAQEARVAKDNAKTWSQTYDRLKDEIEAKLRALGADGDADLMVGMTANGVRVAQVRYTSGHRFDQKKFRAEQQELWDHYQVPISSTYVDI